MIVLGFDTATPATAVGLMTLADDVSVPGHAARPGDTSVLHDAPVLEARDDPGPGERPGHSTRLLALADELLARAGLDWSRLDRIAVGIGPGTFTGLRIGVATARGLAQSLGVRLVGVSSLHALAHGAAARAPRVLAAIDARRGEAFVAPYLDGRPLGGPFVLAPERLSEALVEPAGAGWLAVGDGAVRYASILRDLGVQVPDTDSPVHRIHGAAVCRLGALAPADDELRVLPDYGRRPDAEIALEQVAG